ncbi:MAG: Ig-like domain-containing protein [Acidimicrobiia bacterium]
MRMIRNPTHHNRHTIGLLLTLFLLVGVLVTVTDSPATATPPGANGKIAYERSGDPDAVWIMEPDGSGMSPMTTYPTTSGQYEPTWSPDGTRVAYRLDPPSAGATDDIYLRILGVGIGNLTETPGIDEAEPAWSPDGTKIAYTRGGAIWTMNADGSNQSALTSPPFLTTHHEPAWSPDGTKIAYRNHPTLSKTGADIHVVNANGIGTVNLTSTPSIHEYEPSWSPDGTRIAYRRDGNIWTMNADGTNQTRITASGAFADLSEPAWSPDGTKIAFRLDPTLPGTNDDIYVMNADGTDLVNLTNTAGLAESGPAWQPVNRRPVTVDDAYATPYETSLTVAAPGVLGNDTDPDGDSLSVAYPSGVAAHHGTLTMTADGSFTYTPAPGFIGDDAFTYYATDGVDLSHDTVITVTVSAPGVPTFVDDTVGLVNPLTGVWFLRSSTGVVTSFYYGNPGDVPFMGDWNCDGTDTPGLFRTSDAYAYLRDTNTEGVADIRFFFGNPSDMPLAGDFNGDGCDTLSLYRPSEARFYIINELGEDEGGLGAADYSFLFGDAGDKPVVGDWDGDGVDEIGLHRESSGFFYYRDTLTTGIADGQFYFGDPGDRFVAGDWGIIDSADTPAVFRPANLVFYFRHTLTQGNADAQFTWTGAGASWLPVAGDFALMNPP